MKLADKTYLCEIFGSARENHGKLSIYDLQDKIPDSENIKEDDMTPLKNHENGVIIFMGAGDVQKFQVAYENVLTHS